MIPPDAPRTGREQQVFHIAMHASSVDLSTTLVALGKIPGPPKEPIFVPTPNHDHVVDDNFVTTGQIWWEVRPVLVMDQSDWPAADGSSGITSSEKMDAAKAQVSVEATNSFVVLTLFRE